MANVPVEKSNNAQWGLVATATVPAQSLIDAEASGDKLIIADLPAGTYMVEMDINGTAWTTSTGAATMLVELLDVSDGSQVAELAAAVNLETGGRQNSDQRGVAKTSVATQAAVSPATFTNVATSFDVEVNLTFYVEGRANESLE